MVNKGNAGAALVCGNKEVCPRAWVGIADKLEAGPELGVERSDGTEPKRQYLGRIKKELQLKERKPETPNAKDDAGAAETGVTAGIVEIGAAAEAVAGSVELVVIDGAVETGVMAGSVKSEVMAGAVETEVVAMAVDAGVAAEAVETGAVETGAMERGAVAVAVETGVIAVVVAAAVADDRVNPEDGAEGPEAEVEMTAGLGVGAVDWDAAVDSRIRC